ncbi:unnamed protein product [Aureobasidium uvarum]|uniref:Uncharacterized protein n=1 Tax=Aureobasidium uvarum TaxID=2773716 RepID=A0A9N8KJX5_9PEZI|nr:unnamed protein product [Aureobasidium uvarum]
MAGALFMDAIGLFGTGLGIIQFGLDNFAAKPKDPQGTIVGIKAGAGEGASNTLGGKISKVYAYDHQNVQIGTAGKQTMAGNGDYLTFTVDQDVPGAQGQFIGIQNGNDATCVAWITVQMHDNSLNGVWTGDIGRACGQTWFESQEVAGKLEDGSLYHPSCTWLDGNHDNGIPSASLKFATYAYGNELSHLTLNDACASTMFAADETEITDAPFNPGKAKRDNASPRPCLPWMEQKLIVSNIATHSATNLCNSNTSWGPDFASPVEGKLCDMSTKTLYTLCSMEDVDGCVDIATNPVNGTTQQRTVATRKLSVAKRTVNSPIRSYEETDVWGDDQ